MYYVIDEVVSYTHRKGDNVLPHKHCYPEIIVYKNGNGVITVGDEEFSYSGKFLVLVPRGVEHYERTYSETAVRTCVYDSDYFTITEPIIIKDEKFASQIERIYDIMDGMAKTFIEKGEKTDASLKDALSELLYIVDFVCNSYKKNFDNEFVSLCDNVKKFVKTKYNENINFEVMAENIGYSYSRFRHIFVETVGVGLKAYQLGIRMNTTLKLLAKTDMPVVKIARMVGYKNYICFFNYFKRIMNITPLQYRDNVQKGKDFYNVNTFNLLDEE